MFFFNLHSKSIIGYKLLSDADLGTGISHQTHIGLYENTFDFISNYSSILSARLLYNNGSEELQCWLDFIETPQGGFRSPKIRIGERGTSNSVVAKIRNIVKAYPIVSTQWFLIWFGLESEEMIFLLFNNHSAEYQKIINLIPSLSNKRGGTVIPNSPEGQVLYNLLEIIVNDSSLELLKELETATFQEIDYTKPFKLRKYDVEKSNKFFADTGKKGEELVAKWLKKQQELGLITQFEWVNEYKETGYPYDFEVIENNNDSVFVDVKSTKYTFDQKMIFSNGELTFIKGKPEKNYQVYRVYDLEKANPLMRICDNFRPLAIPLNESIEVFREQIKGREVSLDNLKLKILPLSNGLNFRNEIDLTVD